MYGYLYDTPIKTEKGFHPFGVKTPHDIDVYKALYFNKYLKNRVNSAYEFNGSRFPEKYKQAESKSESKSS